jgi:hypothetical protein
MNPRHGFKRLYCLETVSINPLMQDPIKKRSLARYLAVYGCFSTGMIYAAIGVIAILSFLKIRDGGADESSLLAILNENAFGKFFFWVIVLGTACYIVWRIFETITDPYAYGRDAKGIARRAGIAMSTIPDALIVFTAVQILAGIGDIQLDGRPVGQREMVDSLLQKEGGDWMIIGIGIVVCFTAIVQFWYGITKGYKERLDIARFSRRFKNAIHFLAWVGYFARGIIVGIIGAFFLKAGFSGSGKHVVNTDKAFDYIGDHIGHIYFILVAIGTICYGLFMFGHGVVYDADKD